MLPLLLGKKVLLATKLQYIGKTTALAKTKFADTFAFLFYSFHSSPYIFKQNYQHGRVHASAD
jgi:hypothetical protein